MKSEESDSSSTIPMSSDNKAPSPPPPVYKKNGTRTYNSSNGPSSIPIPNVAQHSRQVSFSGKDHHLVIPGNTIDENNVRRSSLKSIDSTGSSACTSTSTISNGTTQIMSIPSLHHSLMRTQKKKDPYRYYEVIKIMGDGSMGSVAMVKKRKSAIGGSARKLYVTNEKQHRRNGIFKLFPCLLTFCLPNKDGVIQEEETKDGAFTTSIDPTLSMSNDSGFSGITMDQSITASSDSGSNDDDDDDSGTTGARSGSSHSSMISFGGNKKYGVIYALKSIVMDRVSDPIFIKELQNEISILKTLDHPNICKAIETYEYQKKLYLVLELCSGGDLYSRDPYTEYQAKYITRSLLDACAYMHRKNITHRDRKYK